MKKVLLILLALVMVGGMVFAEDPPVEGAKLTLKAAEVLPVLKHGFLGTTASPNDFAAIELALTSNSVDGEYEDFDLGGDGAKDVGHYYFISNDAVSYTVKFQITPFTSQSSAVKVPWKLALSSLSVQSAVTLNSDVIGVGNEIATFGEIGGTEEDVDEVGSSDQKEIFSTDKVGSLAPSYVGLKLTASTDGVANNSFGLPAVADFTATVIASVETP